MAAVKVGKNNFSKALRIFRKQVLDDGVIRDYKERQAFEKPSDKRRRKKNASIRRSQKRVLEDVESRERKW